MAALPGFFLNKKQQIHNVSDIYYVPLQVLHSYKIFLLIIINKITIFLNYWTQYLFS